MRQFHDGDNRNRKFGIACLKTKSFDHLICGLPKSLGGDDHARIENQSHRDGSNGSRWLSIAASTSRAKSASMTAVESLGMRASISEILRRGGTAGLSTAT